MSPHIKIDTLIVSDLHLGSFVSRAKELSDLLTTHTFKRLILLGDVFDNSDFEKLSEENWELLLVLRALSDPDSGREVIWIRGNHDKEIATLMSRVVGTSVHDEYVWEHNNKRFLAMHGDQFDRLMTGNFAFHRLIHNIFLAIQRLDKDARHIVRLLDRTNTVIRRLSYKVAKGAVAHAKIHKANYVFCGHTHDALQKVHVDHESVIHYYNVGCWTRSPSTFAAIDETGNILLEKFA
ncbi:MAG: hypothetical protein QOG91_379 [Candidatus Parcubacteria bacterium]|jgi:UDP-2,3-diacylglucosamine pyrophosphatase LpxH|nr:hypothetical protein [Candidatus Parcubacteria bacterium]